MPFNRFDAEFAAREIGAYRYAFNGKEKEKEYFEGAYDFGERIYDNRIGRWWSDDPLEAAYTSFSPYNFVTNSPIIAFDPDGRLVIFSNGEVGSFGGLGKENDRLRASEDYWGSYFVSKVLNRLGETHKKFIDGDQGGGALTRYAAGQKLAVSQAQEIIDGLERNAQGEITESIYIVSHSKGSAFANGYTDAMRSEIEKQVREGKIKYASGVDPIPLVIHNAPHQSDILNIKTNKTEGDWEKLGSAHNLETFLYENLRVIDQFKENQSGASLNKYNGYVDSLNGVVNFKQGSK
jgi:RHS repeat-associated protein